MPAATPTDSLCIRFDQTRALVRTPSAELYTRSDDPRGTGSIGGHVRHLRATCAPSAS